jgi:polyisoprenoid-binding protein YceI
VSTSIEHAGDELLVHGDLTIRGVTNPVTLRTELAGEGKNPWGKHVAGVEATATLERSQWGLNWNAALEAGGVLVAEKVKLALHIQAVKKE